MGPDQVGEAAWLLDETDLAVRLLREALTRLRGPGQRGGSGGALTALQWACFDGGRWDEALAVAREARAAGTAYGMEPVAARLAQAFARARGLLATRERAGAHYRAALAEPTGGRWPFERAQLRLDYGEWLRRRRRINDAKPVPTEALETFRVLRAAPWAEAELRACGVLGATDPDALAGLTAHQREIVLLAGRGLTNGEIADRLFLSPRTVASHLYRSYPKLGVAGRHQLRDLTG